MVDVIGPVAVLGAGVLGSQIAFQTAMSGRVVTVYDIDDAAVTAGERRLDTLVRTYAAHVTAAAADEARARLTVTRDLGAAVSQADLVIEASPEIVEVKRELLGRVAELVRPAAIIVTNSSTMLPSALMDATRRPQRFLALHFANQIWLHNTAEVMGTSDTDPAVFAAVVEFARSIGMVPIELHKERPGYVLNSLLVPLLNAGMSLVAGGFAEPEAVDATWRIGTGAPMGPLQMLDVIGLETPHNILSQGDARERSLADWLKTTYLDHGYRGVAAGRGFYTYPTV